jgi:hypothetical protein
LVAAVVVGTPEPPQRKVLQMVLPAVLAVVVQVRLQPVVGPTAVLRELGQMFMPVVRVHLVAVVAVVLLRLVLQVSPLRVLPLPVVTEYRLTPLGTFRLQQRLVPSAAVAVGLPLSG